MKKLLTIAALVGVASMSYGQGYVSFFNASGSRVSTNTVATQNGGSTPGLQAVAAVGSYYYAVFAAPTTQTTVDASLAGWTFSGSYGTNIATAGRLLGYTAADGSGTLINGFAVGSTANFVVVGWSANVGTTWAQASAWWNNGSPNVAPTGNIYNFGISGVGLNIPLVAAGSSYNDIMGPSSTGLIQGLALQSFVNIPEPSTFALAGLGAAALLIFRRRK